MSHTNSLQKNSAAVTQENNQGLDEGATIDQFTYDNHKPTCRALNTLRKDKAVSQVGIKSIQMDTGKTLNILNWGYQSN